MQTILAVTLMGLVQAQQYLPPQAPISPVVESIIYNEYNLPIELQNIRKCESHNRQFDSNGDVLRGIVNNEDVGEFQINEYYHLSDSKKMGLDIYDTIGNRKYALYLYRTQGTKPWNASKDCWSKLSLFQT